MRVSRGVKGVGGVGLVLGPGQSGWCGRERVRFWAQEGWFGACLSVRMRDTVVRDGWWG